MPDDDDVSALTDAIRDAALLPQKASGDNGMVEERKIDDIIKARNAIAGDAARAAGRSGFKLTKIIPGGSA
jgi:hypothetical protein